MNEIKTRRVTYPPLFGSIVSSSCFIYSLSFQNSFLNSKCAPYSSSIPGYPIGTVVPITDFGIEYLSGVVVPVTDVSIEYPSGTVVPVTDVGVEYPSGTVVPVTDVGVEHSGGTVVPVIGVDIKYPSMSISIAWCGDRKLGTECARKW